MLHPRQLASLVAMFCPYVTSILHVCQESVCNVICRDSTAIDSFWAAFDAASCMCSYTGITLANQLVLCCRYMQCLYMI